jgi:EmrB/QacA subfamily drug resistance transporter
MRPTIGAMSDTTPRSRADYEQRYGPNYRWWVLLTVMIGSVASVMASTIVNVAVPDMSRHFGLSQARAQWLSAGFMAAMTLSMLTTPWLLERYGYRRAYMGAVALLMLGGIGGGCAAWFELVLGMRVAEGLAAGVLQPIPAIIVMRAFGGHEQGRAMGIFSFGVVLAPAIGPSVGGVLVEWFGWRAIFFVVVPFCLVALALARRYLPQFAPGGAEASRESTSLDGIGLVLIAIAVLALLNGIAGLRDAGGWLSVAMFGTSAVALVGFVAHQRRGVRPLVALRLFAHAPFAMGGTVALIYGMALFGSTYLLPVFMQIALKLPPSQSGAVLAPAGFVLALTSPMAGRLADRLRTSRLVSFGLALLAASLLLMVVVGLASSIWLIVAFAMLGRFGLGFVLPSLNLGAMRGLPLELISQGATTINFLRQLGGAVGVSLVGSVLDWRLRDLPGDPVRAFHEAFVLFGLLTAAAIMAAWRMDAAPASQAPRAA